MMNLSEEEILNFLMTSEFNEGLTPEEFKFLLKKFRNFYRVLRGRFENSVVEISAKQKEIQDIKNDKNVRMNQLILENNLLKEFNSYLLDKPLSFRERWKGKIILNENENQRFQEIKNGN